MKILSLICFVFVCVFSIDGAHAASELNHKEISLNESNVLVEQVSRVLIDHYVYPEVAKKMHSFVGKQMAVGEYHLALTLQDLLAAL